MSRSHASRRRALVAAASLLPAPALATTYDLSNQTVNVTTATYTAVDTLNASNVTFNSSSAGGSLQAGVNLTGNDTVNTASSVTLAGALSGSATLFKSSTGTLTLAALSPSFTGPLTVNASGGTLRLGVESPLAGTGGTLTLGSSTTLDLNGFNSPGRTVTYSGGNSVVNNNTTATSTLSSLPANNSLALGGAGTLSLAAPLQDYSLYTKVGTGTLTLSSVSPSFHGEISVSAGTVQLGNNAPFAGAAFPAPYIYVASGASLDLNGFSPTSTSVSLSNGATLVNNNAAVTPSLSSLTPFTVSGTLTLGGAADINLTAKATTFAKTGTGTVNLNATNASFAGTITINDGTVRLNAPNAAGTTSTHIALNNTVVTSGNDHTITAAGVLDLNGYPAPGGTYTINTQGAPFPASIVNNNTSTPSTIDSNAKFNVTPIFGGTGEIICNQYLSGNVSKFGFGTLTLNYSGSQQVFVDSYQGLLRLGNPAANAYNYCTFNIHGPSIQVLDRYSALDLNGRSSTSANVYLSGNSGIVNNNTATPATLDNGLAVQLPYSGSPSVVFHFVLGGDGTLNVAPNPYSSMSGLPVDKVGAGLLTLPSSFASPAVYLRGGTFQAEQDGQVGGPSGTLSFLGGTLRVAPLYLAPKLSYTFSAAISVDPAGGTIDTQRDTSLTGAFSGSGTLTKAGTATLTLSQSPSATVNLSVSAGTVRFAPTLPAATVGSLTISPGSTLDLRNTTLTTTTPYTLLRQYLHDALLFSSTADATHVLGCKDTNPGTYYIQLTLRGDANLDGVINADDYALLDRGLATHTATWTSGDFNYDGTVDTSDYLAIDTAFGQAQGFSPGFLSTRESQFGPAYVSQLLASVPEPSAAAHVIAGLSLAGRRRRRQ